MKFSASFSAFFVLSCMSGAHALDVDISLGSGGSHSSGWQLSQHLGNLSPYFKAPVPNGIKETLPGDCNVDQVMTVRALSFPSASQGNMALMKIDCLYLCL